MLANMFRALLFSVCLFAISTASPASPILRKLDDLRYQYEVDAKGQNHLVDLWMTLDDVSEVARYEPHVSNVYHLFTRSSPSVSQPLLFGNLQLLGQSFYDDLARTIVLIHGWRDTPLSDIVTVLVPAFLAAEDVNVLVVDWTAGAGTINYAAALSNTITSGIAVGQFINWLNQVTQAIPVNYHIVGQGLGGHQAGIVGRWVQGDILYITGLDPSLLGWINHSDRFHPDDATYTEVIHTNAGINGYIADLAQVDFYPNGGESMPGCDSHACDHARSIFYFAESITSGGFTGRRCASFLTAILQICGLPETLQMGGLRPKIGSTGVYLLETNAFPPFSRY